MLSTTYEDFIRRIKPRLPADRIITDPLRTIAYGTDASFYRLIPKIVINVENEREVQWILREAGKLALPVTFRAAGTSLSGQAITDSILVRLGPSWTEYGVLANAGKIRLQPGIIGGHANRILAEFDRKIGPDPASIDSAKIGGILANNASGMCCGVEQNSYRTLDSMRLILADGTLVDTADDKSRASFRRSHGHLLKGLSALRARVLADPELAERIRYKFKIKNTTGYSLNSLVDFDDPFEIMQHLLVGSEGTLGFIAEAVFRTVIEHRHKASALLTYPDIRTACEAAICLQRLPVSAAELMDRAALASVTGKPGMPVFLDELAAGVTALLIETRAESAEALRTQIDQIKAGLAHLPTVRPIEFTAIPDEFNQLWKIRKGLFPAVGAVRRTGTTVIIEDVAFPIEHLANATLDLQDLLGKYHYYEAIIFGHALAGNLHFVFTQDFSSESEVVRYRDFMDEVVRLVVDRYDGSLKAEHGTGRNMAPFVEKEWGEAAFGLMKDIKRLFDPKGLLNPGVIINDDLETHVKNLKPLPPTHELVDKCIECGFCEPICPSKNLTFTPRQRIAGRREISRRMMGGGGETPLAQLVKAYRYPAMDTCAADGLCATLCPVGIDTGKMVKMLRQEAHGSLANKAADWTAAHFDTVAKTAALALNAVDRIHRLAGTPLMEAVTTTAHRGTMGLAPQWNRAMPTGSIGLKPEPVDPSHPLQLVYFPSCASRAMGGPARDEAGRPALPQRTFSLLNKAGYTIILPDAVEGLCCGQAFESKGFMAQADRKAAELNQALLKASRDGAIPVLCDTSPCLMRMRATLDKRLHLLEPIEFVLQYLKTRLRFQPKETKIAIHPTCSTRKMGLDGKLLELAQLCASEVVMPENIFCCGFAGDRGFNFPELNKSALHGLAEQVHDCEAGYSTSKTCEIGLALHGDIPYRSILDLVDEVTEPLA